MKNQMRLISSAATRKNTKMISKPNEDKYLIDDINNIYIIVDGVTRNTIDGIYPNPSPSEEVSDLFIENAYNYLLQNKNKYDNYLKLIQNTYIYVNNKVHEYNSAYKGDFLPGTIGIIVMIKEEKLFFGYIGDCTGILINKKEKHKFTKDQTKLIHEHIREFTALQVRNEICNNIQHPYSYGVIDGRQGAMDFVVTGEKDLYEYNGCVLSTDGAEDIIGHLTTNQLLTFNAETILNMTHLTNNTDDKTVILIRRDFE